MASNHPEQNPMDEHTRTWANDPDWLGKEYRGDRFLTGPLFPKLSRRERWWWWWRRMVNR